MRGSIRLAGLVALLTAAAPCAAWAAAPAAKPVAQAPSRAAPPVPPQEGQTPPASGTPVLPPGWVWGVESDNAGNRVLVPIAPDEPLPARASLAEDPVERARARLDMLRMALEAYHAAHRPGLAVYPDARSLDDLVRILRRERTLPEGWDPGGVVTEFKISSTGYLVRVAVGKELIGIEPPQRDNPLAMFWLPPHRP